MTQSLCILGRQPALGIAELESLFGAAKLQLISEQAVIIDLEPVQINFSRLGGTIKFCKVLTTLETTDWPAIRSFLETSVPQHAKDLDDGKLTLGLSAYGLRVTPQELNATGLSLKKIIKKSRPVRVVPNTETFLNSAQVLHNKLTQKLGWELILVGSGKRTVVAQNIAEQDIEAYAARDQARPKRDARVGMLPPKLAQIIINLTACPAGLTVLDPFCGTGVLLQEALLMGYGVYGTDLEPRMIDYSRTNLDWLVDKFEIESPIRLSAADATNFAWQPPFDTIAAETYLGRPLSTLPDPTTLLEITRDVDTIHRKFLKNLAPQLPHGNRLCLAVPTWKTASGFKHLPTLDKLTDLGYNRVSFAHVSHEQLIYHRPEQIVARELVVLQRT